MFRLIITTILTISITSFFIEIEDTATKRSAHIYGLIKLGHYHIDNKLALFMEGAVSLYQLRPFSNKLDPLISQFKTSTSCIKSITIFIDFNLKT